jgi:hypothetical protein
MPRPVRSSPRAIFSIRQELTGAAAEPTGPRPLSSGSCPEKVAKSRAYVEDPVTKMVRGYQIGDTVAGWRLDQIREDRVVIAGAERGMLEVLLRDPGKPRPALVASAVAAVMTDAPAMGPGAAEARRVEPGSPPAQPTTTPTAIRDPVARGIGPIPSQLFRPARAASQARVEEQGHEALPSTKKMGRPRGRPI